MEIEMDTKATAEELLAVQAKIIALLYNMDQTPIQAEMPSETTLEKTGAKSACITTGGKEKLRYTVVLTVRGDGQKMRPRIIYKGSPFVGGTKNPGAPKKPGKNSISYEHLPEK
ncbi:unnamed protein product, partial [Pylaiella littoralis]